MPTDTEILDFLESFDMCTIELLYDMFESKPLVISGDEFTGPSIRHAIINEMKKRKLC